MAESEQIQVETPASSGNRRQRWDAVGVIIASLVGLLALLVSGYTAYIQRQQVRAEVWPYLYPAYQSPDKQLTIFNKGMGPAIVRSARLTVDGSPQTDWKHTSRALGLPGPGLSSTLVGTVLSPGDALALQQFPDETSYQQFRRAMDTRGLLDICYCSTLNECWLYEDRHTPTKPIVTSVAQCPAYPSGQTFLD